MAVVGVGLALFFVGAERPVATAPDPVRGNVLAAASGLTWALTVCGLRWMGAAAPERGAAAAAVVAGNLHRASRWRCRSRFRLGTTRATDWGLIVYLGVFQIAVAYTLGHRCAAA